MIDAPDNASTDIPDDNWIDRLAPTPTRPYLRLARADRPIGTWLLLLPCWWGVALATPGWPPWPMIVLFAIGSLFMRGAGCTVNDIADKDFDAQVARTATRPIASGEVSIPGALLFLGLQLLIGLAILVQFNAFTVILGTGSLVLVAAYPFMKRITYWPQLFLGFTFNWGALLGWAAVTGGLAAPAVALYLGSIFWTLGYDTIYAHQDKEDDILVGVKSTALKFGDATGPWLAGFYAIAIGLFGTAGLAAGLHWPFYAALLLGAVHFGRQIRTVDISDPKNCLATFKSNRDFGFILLAGIIAGQIAG